jgi:hypothetical protein
MSSLYLFVRRPTIKYLDLKTLPEVNFSYSSRFSVPVGATKKAGKFAGFFI